MHVTHLTHVTHTTHITHVTHTPYHPYRPYHPYHPYHPFGRDASGVGVRGQYGAGVGRGGGFTQCVITRAQGLYIILYTMCNRVKRMFYRTLAAYIHNDAKTKPCISDCAGKCEDEIISLKALLLCEDSTLDYVSCKALLR